MFETGDKIVYPMHGAGMINSIEKRNDENGGVVEYFILDMLLGDMKIMIPIKNIEQAWQEQFPEYLFQYSFLDDYVGRLYREEERMFGLFEIFAGIAIFIGCLGLYGLASFMAQQKTKEIAIRKTLGASVTHIVALFSRDFVLLVVVAFVLAVPVAWYAMNLWLEDFAFKVEITWIVFAIGIVSTLAITFITVGYRSLRAAIANPVDALKSE